MIVGQQSKRRYRENSSLRLTGCDDWTIGTVLVGVGLLFLCFSLLNLIRSSQSMF